MVGLTSTRCENNMNKSYSMLWLDFLQWNIYVPLGSNSLNIFLRAAFASAVRSDGNLPVTLAQSISAMFLLCVLQILYEEMKKSDELNRNSEFTLKKREDWIELKPKYIITRKWVPGYLIQSRKFYTAVTVTPISNTK